MKYEKMYTESDTGCAYIQYIHEGMYVGIKLKDLYTIDDAHCTTQGRCTCLTKLTNFMFAASRMFDLITVAIFLNGEGYTVRIYNDTGRLL